MPEKRRATIDPAEGARKKIGRTKHTVIASAGMMRPFAPGEHYPPSTPTSFQQSDVASASVHDVRLASAKAEEMKTTDSFKLGWAAGRDKLILALKEKGILVEELGVLEEGERTKGKVMEVEMEIDEGQTEEEDSEEEESEGEDEEDEEDEDEEDEEEETDEEESEESEEDEIEIPIERPSIFGAKPEPKINGSGKAKIPTATVPVTPIKPVVVEKQVNGKPKAKSATAPPSKALPTKIAPGKTAPSKSATSKVAPATLNKPAATVSKAALPPPSKPTTTAPTTKKPAATSGKTTTSKPASKPAASSGKTTAIPSKITTTKAVPPTTKAAPPPTKAAPTTPTTTTAAKQLNGHSTAKLSADKARQQMYSTVTPGTFVWVKWTSGSGRKKRSQTSLARVEKSIRGPGPVKMIQIRWASRKQDLPKGKQVMLDEDEVVLTDLLDEVAVETVQDLASVGKVNKGGKPGVKGRGDYEFWCDAGNRLLGYIEG